MFLIGIYGSIYGRTVNIHGTFPFHKLVLLWHCCENPLLIVKCLNSCDDLQSSFSSKCRITHEILRVFTSISKAALNILGGIHHIHFKMSNQLLLFRHLRFLRAPSASIQPVNETQLDHFSPRQASSSNTRVWDGSCLCQEVYFRPHWHAAAELQ